MMDWKEIVGVLACLAVLASLCMSTMPSLRIFALISNVLFVSYGLLDHIYPVLALHLILLPVNCGKLWQLRSAGLRSDIRSATGRAILVDRLVAGNAVLVARRALDRIYADEEFLAQTSCSATEIANYVFDRARLGETDIGRLVASCRDRYGVSRLDR